MRTRSATRIASLLIALIFLFAALPASAVNDFKYEGIDSASGRWKFSWNTAGNEEYSDFQFKGGDITNVWTTINSLIKQWRGGRTYTSFSPLSSAPSGKTFNFRARVHYNCQYTENGENCSVTDWAYLDVTFD